MTAQSFRIVLRIYLYNYIHNVKILSKVQFHKLLSDVRYALKFKGRELLIRIRKSHDYIRKKYDRAIFFQRVELSGCPLGCCS